jgi:uncharacterized protein YggE
MRAIFLSLAALTFSTTAQAGTSYQVKGEATLQAAPDLATIDIPFLDYADSSATVLAQVQEAMAKVIGDLKKAGVAESDIEVDGEKDAVRIHDKAGAVKFAAFRMVLVSVRDFTMLPKLTELVAANRNDWNLSYSFIDRAKFADALGKAAVADATQKADRYAKANGLKDARIIKAGKLRICSPFKETDIPDCMTVGESSGTLEIVVTARRRDEVGDLPREKFRHIGPAPQILTATMDTTFELQ